MKDVELDTLISNAKQGNTSAMDDLLNLFRPKAVAISREYFLIGADDDDLVQFALIGLFKAISIYEPSKNKNFGQFASLCIHHELQNAVKLNSRKKNLPLNSYVPIKYYDGSSDDESHYNLVIVDDSSDIEQNFLSKETRTILLSKIKEKLSRDEVAVLKLFLRGEKYNTIASNLNITTKKVDNTIQSIKKKLKDLKGDF